MSEIEKPDFVKEDHLLFLDDLRESGVTNMYRATPYLMKEFAELNKNQAMKVLIYWMNTFGERHPKSR